MSKINSHLQVKNKCSSAGSQNLYSKLLCNLFKRLNCIPKVEHFQGVILFGCFPFFSVIS